MPVKSVSLPASLNDWPQTDAVASSEVARRVTKGEMGERQKVEGKRKKVRRRSLTFTFSFFPFSFRETENPAPRGANPKSGAGLRVAPGGKSQKRAVKVALTAAPVVVEAPKVTLART